MDDVIAKIDAIGKVKLDKDSKAKITAARAAYDALDDELKAQVTNYNTLLAAEKRYQQLRDKQNANDGSTSDSADGKTDSKTDGKNVKSGNTADNSHLTLWLGGVVGAAPALALLARKRRLDANFPLYASNSSRRERVCRSLPSEATYETPYPMERGPFVLAAVPCSADRLRRFPCRSRAGRQLHRFHLLRHHSGQS